MTFSKVVSGMGGAPSGLLKSGTNIASKSGKDWVSYGGRRAALDPAITFLAPLNRDTQDDLGAADTFTRASDGLYLPYNGADWRIAGANAPRHEDGKILMEPAITNKNTNYNANPDAALTNITELTATKSRVYDPVTLESVGLSSVCSDGNLIQLENTSGAASFPSIGGTVGSTNTHTISMWINTFGADVDIGLSSNRFTVNTSSLQMVSGSLVPVGTGNVTGFVLNDGEKIQFVLNQLEESPVVTSPIITLGAAGQRAVDVLSWAGVSAFFNQTQGMCFVSFYPLANIDAMENNLSNEVVSLTNAPGIIFQRRADPNWQALTTDGTLTPGLNLSPIPVAGASLIFLARWRTTPAELYFSAYHSGAWEHRASVAYDGAFTSDDVLRLMRLIDYPVHVSNLIIYDEWRDSAWVESNY